MYWKCTETFGFIMLQGRRDDLFCSALQLLEGKTMLTKNAQVSFEIGPGKGKNAATRMEAKQARVIGERSGW